MRILAQDIKLNCGQTCVAMVAEVSIRAAEKACGTRGRTSYAKVRRGLRKFGWELCERKPYRGVLPQRAMVRLKTPKGSHWVVVWNWQLYEPSLAMVWTDVQDGLKYLMRWGGLRPTTYAEVERDHKQETA